MTNSATEAERAQAAEIAAFKHWLSTLHPDAVPQPWDAWQAARAIPLAAAEPVAYLAEDDEGNVGLGRTVRHAMRSCEPGATVTPLIRASIAAPDRAPSMPTKYKLSESERAALAEAARTGASIAEMDGGGIMFINRGEDYGDSGADLNCPACGGSGHKDDVSPDRAPSTDSATERDARLTMQGMADCMDMVRGELIEAGIIDKGVAPMFLANAVCARFAEAERDAGRYRCWRDGMLASDPAFVEKIQDALPQYVGSDSAPTVDEWDAALDAMRSPAIAAMKGEGDA